MTGLKRVFTFQEELKADPAFLAAIQEATLDPEEKVFGLKGSHGLLGTEEWWSNVRSGVIRSFVKEGVVVEVMNADSAEYEPSFEMDVDGGQYEYHQCFVNDRADLALYKPGARVKMIVALDEGKSLDEHGKTRYLDLVLEVFVST